MFSDFVVSFDRFEVRVARFGLCQLLLVCLRLRSRVWVLSVTVDFFEVRVARMGFYGCFRSV